MSKKFKAIISGICALTCVFVISVQASASSYHIGDLDGDGKITSADALLILQSSVGLINEFPVDKKEDVSGNIVASVTTENCSKDIEYNGKTAVSLSLEYPVVEIAGNKVATKAINQTLQRIRLQQNVIDELYDETISAWSNDVSTDIFSNYDISYEVCRNSNILSFKIYMSSYIIGAVHGSHGVNTLNFDLSTGSLIGINDLVSVNNYSDFAYKYASVIYNEIPSDVRLVSSEYDVVSQMRENWYINTDGTVSYVFSPYQVAAYVAGAIDVNIGNIEDYITDYYADLLK